MQFYFTQMKTPRIEETRSMTMSSVLTLVGIQGTSKWSKQFELPVMLVTIRTV